MKDLEISDTATKITEEALSKSSTHLLPPGCVLLTSRATVGFTAINTVSMCTNQGFANFDCGPRLVNYYLAYYLPHIRETLLQYAGGSIFKEISKSTLKEIELPLPPLPVQERIVQILQKADEVRRKRKEALRVSDALIPSIFNHVLALASEGDPPKSVRVADVAEIVTKGTTPTTLGRRYVFSGIPFLRAENVLGGMINSNDCTLFIDEDTHNGPLKRSRLRSHDVVITIAGTIGRTGMISESISEMNCNQAVALIRPRSEAVLPAYLRAALADAVSRGAYEKYLDQKVGQPNISLANVRDTVIPLPPRKVQEKFVMLFESLLDTARKTDDMSSQTSRLFQGILARAFTGELTDEWEVANAKDIVAQQALHERLPRLTVLALLAEKAKRASHPEPEVLVTALMKYAFLLQMEGNGGQRRLYHFVPYHYGPFAKELYAELETLQGEGLVRVDNDSEEEKTKITVVDPAKVKDSLSDLPDDLKEDAATIIETYGDLGHAALLKTVYEKYPAYAKKSRLLRRRRK